MNVDNSNNLFVTDIGNYKVYEYGPTRATQTVFAIQNPAGVGGVAADAAGNVYLSTDSSFNIYRYAPGGGAPTGNPYSNVGGDGLVYSPGTNSLFAASAPSLIQYNLGNSDPSTNWSTVSGGFPGTEYLTVQPVPEPASGVLLSLGALLLCAHGTAETPWPPSLDGQVGRRDDRLSWSVPTNHPAPEPLFCHVKEPGSCHRPTKTR